MKTKINWLGWAYSNYIDSPAWKKIRISRLELDNYKCSSCGDSPKTLICHHLTYKRIFNERLKDLRMVCIGCHNLIHRTFKTPSWAGRDNCYIYPEITFEQLRNKMWEGNPQDLMEEMWK